MTQLASIAPGDRVLELGTGSGYQAAVLAELGAEIALIICDARLGDADDAFALEEHVRRHRDHTQRGRRTAESDLYFVVRPKSPGSTSKILLQLSANTYNAYNNWGGFSLYAYNGRAKNQGSRVSFHRPGGSQFYNWEHAFVAWAEEPAVEGGGGVGDARPAAPAPSAQAASVSSPPPKPAVAPEDRRRVPAALRFRVLERDRFRCRACGASPANDPACTLEADHIRPLARGGKTAIDNLRTLCARCNRGKGARMPRKARKARRK